MHKKKQNLFDTASQMLGKAKPKKRTSATDSSAKKKAPLVEKVAPVAVGPDQETLDMIERMRTLRDDFKRRLRAIYSQNNVTEEQVNTFFSNPKNFTPAEWKSIQEIQKVMPVHLGKPSAEEKKMAAQTEKNLKRKRTTKTIGARKQWMPMK